MSHELNRQLDRVRRRARGHLLLWALGQSICAVVAALFAWSVLDFILRFEQPIWRCFGTVIAAGAVIYSLWRWLIPAARVELSDAALAARLGRRFPELGEPLYCCVQLLDQSADSATLRRATINRVTEQMRTIDPADAVDVRPSRIAASRAGILLLFIALFVIISPNLSRVAMARLVAPLGTTAWPQRNNLTFEPEVRQVVRGAALTTRLVDRSGVALPSPVTLEFAIRQPDGTEHVERQVIETAGDFVEVRRDNITRPIRYRARGGDDRLMSWIDVALLDSPRIERVDVQVTPPPSTGLSPIHFDRRELTVPAGSAIVFTVVADRPVHVARLFLSDDRTFTGRIESNESSQNIVFGGAQSRPVVIDQDVQYWISLTDTDGVVDPQPRRYWIRTIKDRPPELTILAPRDRCPVLASAVVSLQVRAADDYSVDRLTLNYRLRLRDDVRTDAKLEEKSDDERWQQLMIFSRDVMSDENEETNRLLEADGDTYRYVWAITPDSSDGKVELPGLGSVDFSRVVFDYFVSAADGAGQITQTPVRQLIGVDRPQFDRHIESLQHGILDRLEQAESLQNRIAVGLETLPQEPDATTEDVAETTMASRLAAIESDRRQLDELFTGADHIESLLMWLGADLAQNGADTPETRAVLTGLAKGAREIRDRLMQELSVRLAALTQRVDASNLAAARAANDRIGDRLASLMEMLSDWLSIRDFRRRLDQLRSSWHELSEQTSRLSTDLLGRDISMLSADHRSQLAQLASLQRDIAQRLSRQIRTMQTVLDSLGGEDVETVARLTDSLDALRQPEGEAVARMYEVSDRVAENRLAQAIMLQSEVAEMLDMAISRLDDDRRRDLRRRVDRIRAIEKSLGMLARRQAILGRDIENVVQTTDSVSLADRWRWIVGSQATLATDTRSIASKLERLRRPSVAAEVTQAAVRMDDITDRSHVDQPEEAKRAATAALRYLLEARRLISRIRMQAEADLAAEDMLFLQITLDRIIPKQQDLRDRAAQLISGDAAIRATESPKIAAEQQKIATEVIESADSITTMTAVAQLLRQVAGDMNESVNRLQRLQVDQTLIAKMDDSLETLRAIDATIRTDIAPSESPLEPPAAQNDAMTKGRDTLTATEVQLLLTTQEAINARIDTLPDGMDPSKLSSEDRAAYAETIERQRRLVEAAVEVLRAGEDETSRLLKKILEGTIKDLIDREAETEKENEIDRPAPPLIPLLQDDRSEDATVPRSPDENLPKNDGDLLDELFVDDPLDSVIMPKPSTDSVETAPRPPEAEPAADTAEEPKEPDPLVRQLGTAGVSEEESPLIEATRMMRMVQSSLEAYRADRALSSGRQVVAELRRLLEESQQLAAAPDTGTDAAHAGTDSSQGTGEPSSGTADGTPTDDSATSGPISTEQMEFLIDQFRGQLPPRARTQLLNMPVEQFHPKYRRWIEQYYRRMAEREEEGNP